MDLPPPHQQLRRGLDQGDCRGITLEAIGVERTGSRSKSFIAISNIAGTIDESYDYKTDAMVAYSGEPGVAIAFVETA